MKHIVALLLGIALMFTSSIAYANTSDSSLDGNSLVDEALEEDVEQEKQTEEEREVESNEETEESTETEESEESEEESAREINPETEQGSSTIETESENAEVIENSDGSVSISTKELNVDKAILLGVAIIVLIGLFLWKPKKK